jgi:hypothetical protein
MTRGHDKQESTCHLIPQTALRARRKLARMADTCCPTKYTALRADSCLPARTLQHRSHSHPLLPTHLHPTAQVHQPSQRVVPHHSSHSPTTRRCPSRPQRGVVDCKAEGQALTGPAALHIKHPHTAVVVGGHHTVPKVAWGQQGQAAGDMGRWDRVSAKTAAAAWAWGKAHAYSSVWCPMSGSALSRRAHAWVHMPHTKQSTAHWMSQLCLVHRNAHSILLQEQQSAHILTHMSQRSRCRW